MGLNLWYLHGQKYCFRFWYHRNLGFFNLPFMQKTGNLFLKSLNLPHEETFYLSHFHTVSNN